jgi:hypothetical protein
VLLAFNLSGIKQKIEKEDQINGKLELNIRAKEMKDKISTLLS